MSGYELSQFEAKDKVYFQDGGITVLASQISFDARRSELVVRGTETADAEIHDQRKGGRIIRGPVFYWNRSTGRIDAPKSTVIGR